MNASALLQAYGWRGTGHSLDATDRGIKKPLLISHKQDQLGLGRKKAAHTTDDQWWMRAYDQSLQSIGTGKGEESTLSQIRTKGINRGGLYGFFVKGEGMAGTIDDSTGDEGASTPPTSTSETETTKKRKRADDDPCAPTKKAKKPKSFNTTTPDEQAAVSAKIAKMSDRKKAWYNDRAAAKGQTIEDILLRRIRKSASKLAKRNKTKATKGPQSAAGLTFISDPTGDASLSQTALATPAGQTVIPETTAAQAEHRQQRKDRKAAKKLLAPKENTYGSKTDYEKAMKEKKARKKAEKAEKNKGKVGKTKKESKWGKDKVNSR